MSDRIMPCPVKACGYEEWVSPDDEDGSFSELWRHVMRRHRITGDAGSVLMATVEVEER
ncbi:hypothetical protein [Streptomyces sp. NRRL S-920]|uniref:hypothetical protein n=1 Tax=Streptomyces sp. NRRL S-920 TaxID=1463921 RepID=UPI000A9A9C14|nr:hypothetical protein [Streptomyces sp. NRRL S-920]